MQLKQMLADDTDEVEWARLLAEMDEFWCMAACFSILIGGPMVG